MAASPRLRWWASKSAAFIENANAGPREDPLRVVVGDHLDHALLLELLDRCPREGAVDLQSLDERRRRDQLHFGDLREQPRVGVLVEEHLVRDLVADLALGPLLLLRLAARHGGGHLGLLRFLLHFRRHFESAVPTLLNYVYVP